MGQAWLLCHKPGSQTVEVWHAFFILGAYLLIACSGQELVWGGGGGGLGIRECAVRMMNSCVKAEGKEESLELRAEAF